MLVIAAGRTKGIKVVILNTCNLNDYSEFLAEIAPLSIAASPHQRSAVNTG